MKTETDKVDSALLTASAKGHLHQVQSLISARADVNAQNEDGTTALFLSSAFGHLSVVLELIAAGTDVNGQMSDGFTALINQGRGIRPRRGSAGLSCAEGERKRPNC